MVDADCCGRAIELLGAACFDVVVSDHRLPDGQGLDVLRHMRARGMGYKVIYLTAEPEELTDAVRRELDVDQVLCKPVDLPQLIRELQRFVSALAVGTAGQSEVASPTVPPQMRRGRFCILQAPQQFDDEFRGEALRVVRDEPWLAVECTKLAEVDPVAVGWLVELARQCRMGNGRLCLVGGDGRILDALKGAAMRAGIDLFPDPSWLEPAGRRPAASCERDLVLASVVRRDGQ
jgi:CheY-like chemotaxis protein